MRVTFLILLLLLNSACCVVPRIAENAVSTATLRNQPWSQRFVDNGGVRIEYRVREALGAAAKLTPVVFIPGMNAAASVWENNLALVRAFDASAQRKLIAISLRGRGASDCPETGWTPQHHHSDIAAVIRAEKLANYHLITHSMGTAYGLGFALSRPPNEIRSFVAGDYFPAVIQVNEEWAAALESSKPPLTFNPKMPRHILREQGSQDYAGLLDQLIMPMLVILGRKSMEPRVEALYAKAPRHRVLWIDDGHGTFKNAEAIAAALAHVQQEQ